MQQVVDRGNKKVSGAPQSEHALVGSNAWQWRREQSAHDKGRRYNPIGALKAEYRYLEERADALINGHGETAYGKSLHATIVNRMELTDALRRLPERQRHCWILHTMDELSTHEIALALGIRQNAVERAISYAGAALKARIFDPLDVREH